MFYVVRQMDLWGDFGLVLVSGFAERRPEDGSLLLHRAGPFLPPISFPWILTGGYGVVLADAEKARLERLSLSGIGFRKAIKSHIVELNWQLWNLDAELPERFPHGDEPEGYLGGSHNARVSDKMSDAWELLAPLYKIDLERAEDPKGGYLDIYLSRDLKNANVNFHIFTEYEDSGAIIVNDYGKSVFEEIFDKWVKFMEIKII